MKPDSESRAADDNYGEPVTKPHTGRHGDADSKNRLKIHLRVSESLSPGGAQFVDLDPGKNCVMKINESRNCLLVTWSP